MNEKIPLRSFAEKVAEMTGQSAPEAESLIKRLFELVAEGLHEGRKVDIKGLGTFSLSEDPSDPVTFSPASAWAERVNAPFAMFEPEELAEEASESDFEAIVTTTIQPDPTPVAINETVETAEETEAEEAPSVTEAATESVTSQTEPAPETITEEVTAKKVAEPEAMEDVPVTPSPIVEETPATEESPVTEETIAEQNPIEETEPAEEAEYEAVEEPSDRKSFSRGFIVGLIVGLAIGALGLCCYVMYFVHSSGQPQTVETELVESAPMPME